MQKKRFSSFPVLLLTLVGVLSIFALLSKRSKPAKQETPQVQTLEQQRMAALYFRILSFLSDVVPKGHSHTALPASPKYRGKKAGAVPRVQGRSELCRFLA